MHELQDQFAKKEIKKNPLKGRATIFRFSRNFECTGEKMSDTSYDRHLDTILVHLSAMVDVMRFMSAQLEIIAEIQRDLLDKQK